MEVSALLGRMPSAVGYQPTLASEMGALEERITSTDKGSITSIQAIYVGFTPQTGETRPVPGEIRALVDHFEATGQVLPLSDFPELARAAS